MPDKALFPVLDFNKFAFVVVVVVVFELINSYKMEKYQQVHRNSLTIHNYITNLLLK